MKNRLMLGIGLAMLACSIGLPSAFASDDNINMCYRNRTIQVPLYLQSRYMANGATDGACGPIITDVRGAILGSTSAVVTWTTDVDATSQVDYGTTPDYGSQSILQPTLTRAHVTVFPLAADEGTIYHFRVRSMDSSGKISISTDYTFTRLAGPGN